MPGFAFWGGDEDYPYYDSFLISTSYMDEKIDLFKIAVAIYAHSKRMDRAYRRASVYMLEL
ncbi:MAG: hypothetical protein KAW45_08300 [Thermoplasmatales archaeon]|nr:hypothetical protein [Thermoplasmatales archaeon]